MAKTLFGDAIISSTELKNNQKKWFDKAAKAPISITNTGGRHFVLINRDQIYNLMLSKDYAGLILKYCKAMTDGLAKDKFVSEAFPWAKHLSKDDRLTFGKELVAALDQAIQTSSWIELDELISDWQATAEALTNSRFMEVVKSPPDKREYTEVE